MTKNKRNTIAVFAAAALLIASVAFIAPALQSRNREIPFGQEFDDINDLAGRLNVSAETLEEYLTAIDSDYGSYVKYLNEIQTTPEQLTANIRESTGYEFSDYIQTLTLISNKNVPDGELYDKIATGGTSSSEDADIDVYVSKISRRNLENNGIKMLPTTTSGDEEVTKYFHLFALLSYVNGDVPTFISGANGVFGCESVEITNVNVYGNYGVKKPEDGNEMIDGLFNAKEDSGEMYKAIPMPVMTLKYEDDTKDVSFGVLDSAGIIFVARNSEILKKLGDTDFFDMHIRQIQVADTSVNKEES